ncbi:MAG: TlyA family RNA methyltransferase [Chloroflexi bacterium]|nr:TlyA family RNA methyltransferase [Chloroflexota bacterium]
MNKKKEQASPDSKSRDKSKDRMRLDRLLVNRGIAPTREKAQAMIMAGEIFSGDKRLEKPAVMTDPDMPVEVRASRPRFVSRGGLKLEGALEKLGIDVNGKIVLDIGASTGGFVHCLLERGASRVYAVDVGYGQLDALLRNDARVVVKERFNARYLKRDDIPEEVDLVTADVSFISLSMVIPPALEVLKKGGEVVSLVKPQFEAGRKQVGKGGVVKDQSVHRAVLEKIIGEAAGWGLVPLASCASPLLGPKGNREFFIYLKKGEGKAPPAENLIREAMEQGEKNEK